MEFSIINLLNPLKFVPLSYPKFRLNTFQTYTGLRVPANCLPNLILNFMKHKTPTYCLSNKDDLDPQDIIDTINGDVSDDDCT